MKNPKSEEQLFNWRGLVFDTSDSQVYPPKPASLLLAEAASKIVVPGEKVLEVGTGCGVIAIAIAKLVPGTEVTATDINPAAVRVAAENAARNHVTVNTMVANLYAPFHDGEFDVIAIHPPAIPYLPGIDWGMSEGMSVATNGGRDGSELVVRFITDSKRCLKKGGKLLLLLPHWCNTSKAFEALNLHFTEVTELAKQKIEFFPLLEGGPSPEILKHALLLADQGVIELLQEEEKLFSYASVIQASM